MLDGLMRRTIDPALAQAGRLLAAHGVLADGVTALALASGLAAALLIGLDHLVAALALIALSRLFDGLDGAVARASAKTDRGGYLDIVFDFTFYGAVPLAFAFRDPSDAVPAAVLLFAFYVNGASFLAYAALAAKRGLETAVRGDKSIYFTAGLAEATETILVFALMCILPSWFGWLAWGFAGLTLATAMGRIAMAIRHFS
jgi:phosphatidylglycerophosphate synthase